MDDLISRQAAIDATWEEPMYADPINILTEVRDDNWFCADGKRRSENDED